MLSLLPFVMLTTDDLTEQARRIAKTAEFMFRQKYSLPPTDQRFLTMTRRQIVLDLLAHGELKNLTGDEKFDNWLHRIQKDPEEMSRSLEEDRIFLESVGIVPPAEGGEVNAG
ncbi:MAG: hypothetical protein KAW17_09720 [Candidatus Eisenbacteria sp.]|nr:hypothetical protein [Candidatus Eisenbacteria bacterium]